MYALFFMGFPQALTLTVLKAFFVALTRGVTAGLLSLSGGLVSVLVMWLLYKLPRRPTSVSYTHLDVYKRQVVPLSSALSSSTWAWWKAAPCFTMERPRPVPPISLEWLLSTR